MSTIAQLLQAGQPDLELAACTPRVLLAPFFGTQPILNCEASGGGLDTAKIGLGTSPFVTVGNYEKKAGAKLTNKPTVNKIMSAGYGSPTRNLFSESGRGITYTGQETNLLNLQNSWGFPVSAVGAPSASGGTIIAIPEIPPRLLWRVVLVAGDIAPSGAPIYLWWAINRAETGERADINAIDSNVYESMVTLDFQVDPAVGSDNAVLFGICGQGWIDLNDTNNTGLYPAITGLTNTVTPTGTAMTVAAGAGHTRQMKVVDNNAEDRTLQCTYASSDAAKATVNSTGLVTAVAAGTPTITATLVILGQTYTTTYTPTVS